ncbi:MAG: cardiolipin synthase B, partial [Opitutus sp.]
MSPAKRRPTKKAVFIFLGIVLGIFVTVVAANFVRSEKKIEYPIESPYSVSDPQFVRSIGSLLGNPLIGDNSVTELLNGDAIFPAML